MSGLEVCSIFCKYGVHHLTISKHFNGKVTRCAFRIKIGLYFQRQAAAPKTRTSLLWGALFLHPRLRQMFFVNASQAVPGRTLRSRSGLFFCLPARTQRRGSFCQCIPIESLGTQFAFGAFFIWLDDRAYSGYLFCQRLLKRLNI